MTQRPTKVQARYLADMKEGQPVAIYRSPVGCIKFERQNGGGRWLWITQSTVKTMERNGWIEWRDGDTEKRAGFYITDAGREALPT